MRALLPCLLTVLQAPSDRPWSHYFLDGCRALERGEPAQARDSLEQALRVLPEHAASAWQLAGACALLGERDAAFQWLERSVVWGGGEPALLAWDPDLASLREDPRFARIVAELEARPRAVNGGVQGALAVGRGGISSVGPGAFFFTAANGGQHVLVDTAADEIVGVVSALGQRSESPVISPDGRFVVVASCALSSPRSSRLRVFDARTGDRIRDLEHAGCSPSIQFESNGQRMLVADTAPPYAASIRDTTDWSSLRAMPDGWHQVNLSPDGTRVLAMSKPENGWSDLILWDVDAGREVTRHADLPYAQVSFSRDSALALVVDRLSRRIRTFDCKDGREVHVWDAPADWTSLELCACWIGDRHEFVAFDKQARIDVCDARTGTTRRSMRVPGTENALGIESSADGQSLFVHGRSPAAMIEASDGTVLWRDPWSTGYGVGMSNDGKSVVCRGPNGSSRLRDVRTGRVLEQLHATDRSTVFASDLERSEVWIGVDDGSVRCVSTVTGRTARSWSISTAGIEGLAVGPDSARLAAVDEQGTLRIVDAADGSVMAAFPDTEPIATASPEELLEFSPDGGALTHRRGSSLRLYVGPKWTRVASIDIHDPRDRSAWCPDSSCFAVRHDARSVRLHDSRDGTVVGQEIRVPGTVETLAFAPDAARLWIGSGQSKVHVFRVADQQPAMELDLSDLDGLEPVSLGSIVFRRDGKLAITGSSGHALVAAWDPGDGRRLWGHELGGGNAGAVRSSFGAEANSVFVWGQGRLSRVLDARTGELVQDLGDRYWSLLALASSNLVAGRGRDGFGVVDMRDGRTLWNRGELGRDGWLLSTPAHFVDGSHEALERIHFAMADGSLPLDALSAALLDPKRVRASAAGIIVDPARLPAIPTVRQREPYQRVIRLAVGEAARTATFVAKCDSGVSGFEVVLLGQRRVLAGDEADGERMLQLALDAEPNADTEVRVRAIGRRGIQSRALRITVRRDG